MILAAGRGERMRPLTDHQPKPLLPVAGKSLLFWHLDALAKAGARDIIINHAHLGEQIVAAVGDGRPWGMTVRFSAEAEALETAGGIATAQPWLARPEYPFLVINGDVWTDWDRRLACLAVDRLLSTRGLLAWIWLVDNPPHHPAGDFVLSGERVAEEDPGARLTFSGIGVYHPRLFAGIAPGQRAPLGPLLRKAARDGALGGSRLDADWVDVGTPERLVALDTRLR